MAQDTLPKALRGKIEASSADLVVFDCIRWAVDLEMIRSFPNNIVIYITSDTKTRYERLKIGSQKPGEANLSLERFKAEERVQTETQIKKIGRTADYTLANIGTLDQFRDKVKDLIFRL